MEVAGGDGNLPMYSENARKSLSLMPLAMAVIKELLRRPSRNKKS
jgi:hypothetical protein